MLNLFERLCQPGDQVLGFSNREFDRMWPWVLKCRYLEIQDDFPLRTCRDTHESSLGITDVHGLGCNRVLRHVSHQGKTVFGRVPLLVGKGLVGSIAILAAESARLVDREGVHGKSTPTTLGPDVC